MSSLPPKPPLDLSLPSKPSTSITIQNIAPRSQQPLLSRISHALPPKPVDSIDPPSLRVRSPIGRQQQYRDADKPTRGRSSSPRRSLSRRSPSPRRGYVRRDDLYSPPCSLSPSPAYRREYSHPSLFRPSTSPSKSALKPSSAELPTTFFTFAHKKARLAQEKEERLYQDRQEAIEHREPRVNGFDMQGSKRERGDDGRTGRSSEAENYNGPRSDTSCVFKRGPSPSTLREPPHKTARTAPNAPRGVAGAPPGPRSLPGLRPPVGPRQMQTTAFSTSRTTDARSRQTSGSTLKSPRSRFGLIGRSEIPPAPGSWLDEPEPSAHKHRVSGKQEGKQKQEGKHRQLGGRSPSKGSSSPRSIKSDVKVESQLHSEAFVVGQYADGFTAKIEWRVDPKAYLNELVGEVPRPNFSRLRLEGKSYSRAVLTVKNIEAVGDATEEAEAERIAQLSALLQLKFVESEASSSSSSNAKATLSDGTTVDFERAKNFMEYYCKRYQFPKAEIQYSLQTVKKSKKSNTIWEAVLSVGGRKIGMGTGGTKKAAQINCYLDVTQYLEQCDSELWRDFMANSSRSKEAQLVFQMSNSLHEEVRGLCSDIEGSTIYQRAPSEHSASEDSAILPEAAHVLSPEEHVQISQYLAVKLRMYRSDDKLKTMREQRAALPVSAVASDVLRQIEENDVTILMASTGSGKTTQVPQLLLDQQIERGQGSRCNIICTQPRRLAATSVAERIADERGDVIGGEIGYQVRFDSKKAQEHGSITFCTTGIFLKRMHSSLAGDRDMDKITHIVIDEVHERDINTDLCLVVLKRMLADRKARGIPLKVILMSATINPTLFQNYFAVNGIPAPVVEVAGRSFPVVKTWLDEVVPQLQDNPGAHVVFRDKVVKEYLERELSHNLSDHDTGGDGKLPSALVALITAHVLRQSDDGHVLVFLPGWPEIREVSQLMLRGGGFGGVVFNDESRYSIHFLHSSIPAAEQKRVFERPREGVRRVILATDIAETSVTIPDVIYVVDTGRVKELRYDPAKHTSSLISAWTGQSNLNQRAGRAGRHRPGEYFSLVSHNRYQSLSSHQTVEMKRADLSNVVMHVKALSLGEIKGVMAATIEPPEGSRVDLAISSLQTLGAMDKDQNLTALGRVLVQLPVDVAIGKLCLYGSFFRCLDSALTLAAVLTTRDPFMAPVDMKEEANKIKESWSPLAFRSDPLAIVKAYEYWEQLQRKQLYRQAHQHCIQNMLNHQTLLQMRRVKESLLEALHRTGVLAISAGGTAPPRRRGIAAELNENGESLPLLAALIASASAPNFALKSSPKNVRTAQEKAVMIHPSSVNAKNREQGGPEVPSESFNPAEKRLYTFTEKVRIAGGDSKGGTTSIRSVTRIDPLTYLLFGAHQLSPTKQGLMSDSWLPIIGDVDSLKDVLRLKEMFGKCMLRVFEGISQSLVVNREERIQKQRDRVLVSSSGSSKIVQEDSASNDEEDEDVNEEEDPMQDGEEDTKRVLEPLNKDEIRELDMLTTDIVRLLDAYAGEREPDADLSPPPGTRDSSF